MTDESTTTSLAEARKQPSLKDLTKIDLRPITKMIEDGLSDDAIVGGLMKSIQKNYSFGVDYKALEAEARVTVGLIRAGDLTDEVYDHPVKDAMQTDLGNARALVRLHGVDVRYVHAWKCWLIWRDEHWRRDDSAEIMRKAKSTAESLLLDAMRTNDDRRGKLISHAVRSQGAKSLSAMITLAQSEWPVVLPVGKIDADPYLIGVQNGVVDLRTITFRQAKREDYVTKRAGTIYDPAAACPEWEKFLTRVLPDPAVVQFVQRMVGYSLTGSVAEEVIAILVGNGRNGKSTFRETVFEMFGDYAVAAPPNLVMAKRQGGGATPDLARLHGKRLVTVSETPKNGQLDEAGVKFMTSNETMTARALYEAPFDFPPTHHTWLTTNNIPVVKGTDDGIWRRILLVIFGVIIPESEGSTTFRVDKLMPELPGILNWSLQGLAGYKREGLNPPAAVTDATKDYRSDMDVVGAWIEERCEIQEQAFELNKDLHADFDLWAENNVGWSISAVALGRDLAARGYRKERVHGGRGIRGLKLVGTFPVPVEPPRSRSGSR